VRTTLSGLLEGQGHTVVTAADGEEGLGPLKADESFDLVLIDLGMPGMNGWDVARSIQQSWPRLRVGVITARSEQGSTFWAGSRFVVDRTKLLTCQF
jgi:twitching motility two-component system response regulator PilH